MTPADFIKLQPAFRGVPGRDIQRWLDRADPYFDVSRWDALYQDGLAYWVAHKLVVEGTSQGLPEVPVIGGLAVSKKVGTEEIRYSEKALQAVMEEPMTATSFGREYLSLRDQVGAGAVATLGLGLGHGSFCP